MNSVREYRVMLCDECAGGTGTGECDTPGCAMVGSKGEHPMSQTMRHAQERPYRGRVDLERMTLDGRPISAHCI